MPACEGCGNEYDDAMTIEKGGTSHVFDSFECAIHALAPTCPHCSCRVIGHGVRADGTTYCCAHCARESGVEGVVDSV